MYSGNEWSNSNISVGIVSGNFVAPPTGGGTISGQPLGGQKHQYRETADQNQVGFGLFTPIKFWFQVDLHK